MKIRRLDWLTPSSGVCFRYHPVAKAWTCYPRSKLSIIREAHQCQKNAGGGGRVRGCGRCRCDFPRAHGIFSSVMDMAERRALDALIGLCYWIVVVVGVVWWPRSCRGEKTRFHSFTTCDGAPIDCGGGDLLGNASFDCCLPPPPRKRTVSSHPL